VTQPDTTPHWPRRVVGFGDATSDFQSSLYTSTDPSAIKAGLQAQVASNPTVANAVSSYDQAQTDAAITTGAVAAVSGSGSSDEQTAQAAFAGAAIAGGVLGGMTIAAAAAAVAPLALIAWGGGYALGELITSALGIKNRGPIACTSDDPYKNADNPSSPGWFTFQDYVDSNAPPPNGWPDVGQHWVPATDGPFERWARPVIMRAFELSANCKPIPGVQTWRQFADGLIAVWNAQFPNAPMRTIAQAPPSPDATYGSLAQQADYRLANDPVQWFLRGRGEQQVNQANRAQVFAPALASSSIQVADPTPASLGTTHTIHLPQVLATASAKAAASSGMSTGAKVAVGAAVVVGGALVGSGIYALVKHKPVGRVWSDAWRKVRRRR
jgi:hypothetical protein